MWIMRILCGITVFLLMTGSCGGQSEEKLDSASYPMESVQLIAPAGPGSGYDMTIRSVAQCLADTKLVSVPLPVISMPGGGGSAALDYLAQRQGEDDVLTVYSPPLCLIHLNGATELNYRDHTTPIAQLVTAYGLFAVRSDSPYTTIGQVMETLKRDPKAIRVGGISSTGSMDHIQFLQMAQRAGVMELEEIEYVSCQDGSAAVKLLGGQVDLISTGISDAIGLVESGDIRALAVTSDERVGSGIVREIPTCIEEGIDATFYNWRGIFGPKDMPVYALDYWEETLRQMSDSSQWLEICGKYGWEPSFAGHEDFTAFLGRVNGEYAELLGEVGFLR